MKKETLEGMRQWALDKIHAGKEPPWSLYQHMKLVEALEAILGNYTVINYPAHSPQSEQRPGSGPLRVVKGSQQDTSRPRPSVQPEQQPK